MKVKIVVDKQEHDIDEGYIKRFEALKTGLTISETLDKLCRKIVVDAEANAEKARLDKELNEFRRKKYEEAGL